MKSQVTLEEFKNFFEKYQTQVERFKEKDVDILWIDDYYDGMRVSMLEYQNNKFRFEECDFWASPNPG